MNKRFEDKLKDVQQNKEAFEKFVSLNPNRFIKGKWICFYKNQLFAENKNTMGEALQGVSGSCYCTRYGYVVASPVLMTSFKIK